jgi:hypothetical protein
MGKKNAYEKSGVSLHSANLQLIRRIYSWKFTHYETAGTKTAL